MELIIRSKKYGSHTVFFDKEDAPLIKQYNWIININWARNVECVANTRDRFGKQKLISMQRLLMRPIPVGMIVKHKDKNPLNNTRGNLELGCKGRPSASVHETAITEE